MSINLHRTIRYLETHRERLKPQHTDFLNNMIERLDEYGDLFICSPKQSTYLRSLERQVRVQIEKEHPSTPSRIEELRAKRRRILSRIYDDKSETEDMILRRAGSLDREIRDIEQTGVDARMRHQKSRARQLSRAPSLILGTKK